MAANAILVLGTPGTGKSTSLRNLNPKTTYCILPNAKVLPFRGAKKKYKVTSKDADGNKVVGNLNRSDDFTSIMRVLDAVNKTQPNIKTIVIDDFSHALNSRVYSSGFNAQKGFAKWSDMATEVFESLLKKIENLRDDLTIVIMAHTKETQDSDGNKKVVMRTAGNLLDNAIQIPSYFTYVLHTQVLRNEFAEEGQPVCSYKFLTNTDGVHECKTPEGLFPAYIDNDLNYVLEQIEKYENDEDDAD